MQQAVAVTLNHEPPRTAGSTIIASVARHKVLVLSGFLATAIVVAVTFSAIPRTYRASASLLIGGSEAVLRGGDSSAEALRQGDPADVESQMLLVRSPRLARMILDDPAVVRALLADCEAAREGTWFTRFKTMAFKAPGCETLVNDDQAQLHKLEAGFSIGPTGRSRVIEVAFTASVPEATVIIANALVDAYLRDDKERKVDTHDVAIQWLRAENTSAGEALRKAEQDVEEYRANHGIIRGQLASISSERLSALAQQLATAQAAYAQATSRLGQGRNDGDVPEVLSSRTISDLKQQSAQAAERYADLRQRYGENYPAVQAAANEKRAVDGRLAQETQRVTSSLQRDAQSAAARVAELKQQYSALVHDVGETGGAEAGIAIMVRDVEARREIYVEQLKELNKLQTERRLLAGDARLVSHAELPDRPWFPKKVPFIAVGAVLSSAAGIGFALLRDRGDGTLRTTANRLPELAGIPVVGYLPWVKRQRAKWWLAQQLFNPTPLQESVRALFSRFMLLPGVSPKTVLVASSDVGEGKTFLALSLALFSVTTGRSVLLVEADLRRPTIGSFLNLPSGPGLSEFLRSEATATDIVRQYRGLHIITAGKPVFDSTELLSSSQFDGLLRAASAKYDLIIFDSPPSLAVMDAHVLARRMDAILYCASYGRSQLDRVVRGIRSLGMAGGKVLGVVVGGGDEQDGESMTGLMSGAYLPAQT
jgi:capsular exopolysaccharide synthesis family protein